MIYLSIDRPIYLSNYLFIHSFIYIVDAAFWTIVLLFELENCINWIENTQELSSGHKTSGNLALKTPFVSFRYVSQPPPLFGEA